MHDDRTLIDRARGGCARSFQELVERHGPPVYRTLLRMTGRREDAEDLYQEALLRASEGLRDYRHRGTFAAWLHRIARNLFLDQRKRRRVEEAPLTIEPAAPAESLSDGLAGELQRAVDRLSPKLREVFLLRHHGELRFQEIADLLEAPLGTVLARMSYAVKALRPSLAHLRAHRTRDTEEAEARPRRSRGEARERP